MPENDIIKLYNEGFSSTKIAEKYNVTCHTITSCLKNNGIELNNIYHNKSLNRSYFKTIDSYDKAYFLGLIMTDGSVGSNTNEISITLKAEDIDILKVFSEKIHNENKIYIYKRQEATIKFKSKELKEDLKQYGIIPNKTKYPMSIPNINESLIPHFIRGLIDGDGWISAKGKQIGFCGCEQLVTEVRDFLVKKLNIYNVKVSHTDVNVWQACWSAEKDMESIGNYIYKDKNDCYLKRKYQNFMEIPR